jgi:hypothetical protein
MPSNEPCSERATWLWTIARCNTVALTCNGNGLCVPRDAPWWPDLRAELLSFPAGKHHDQVDVLGLWTSRYSPTSSWPRCGMPQRNLAVELLQKLLKGELNSQRASSTTSILLRLGMAVNSNVSRLFTAGIEGIRRFGTSRRSYQPATLANASSATALPRNGSDIGTITNYSSEYADREQARHVFGKWLKGSYRLTERIVRGVTRPGIPDGDRLAPESLSW